MPAQRRLGAQMSNHQHQYPTLCRQCLFIPESPAARDQSSALTLRPGLQLSRGDELYCALRCLKLIPKDAFHMP